MKKTIVIIASAIVLLSSTLAFRPKSEELVSKQDQKVTSVVEKSGYALQDQNQW